MNRLHRTEWKFTLLYITGHSMRFFVGLALVGAILADIALIVITATEPGWLVVG